MKIGLDRFMVILLYQICNPQSGSQVKQKDLLDLTDMAYKGAYLGVYPSAGGCDEMIRLFLYRVKVAPALLFPPEFPS